MSFEWPIALLALAALPLLVVVYLWQERRRGGVAGPVREPDLLPNVIDREPGRLRYLPLGVLLVGLGMMIFGVARPHAIVTVPREEATVVLAMDVSRSMKAPTTSSRRGSTRHAARRRHSSPTSRRSTAWAWSRSRPGRRWACRRRRTARSSTRRSTRSNRARARRSETRSRSRPSSVNATEVAEAVPRSILLIRTGRRTAG